MPLRDTPVVHAGNAAGLVREHRFDDAPFAVAEFIAHDSMLPFGSLNHAQDQGINGQTACPLLEGKRTYGRHNEIDAIDPLRKRNADRLPNEQGLKVLHNKQPHQFSAGTAGMQSCRHSRGRLAGEFP